jgi:hypothetical protein
MRNVPRNYWETDRLLLIGIHRRGRGRNLQVLILKIRRKEEEEEDNKNNNDDDDDANNNDEDDAVDDDYNNNNDDDIKNDDEDNDDSSSSSKRRSACLRITKDNDDNAQCPYSNRRFQKTRKARNG